MDRESNPPRVYVVRDDNYIGNFLRSRHSAKLRVSRRTKTLAAETMERDDQRMRNTWQTCRWRLSRVIDRLGEESYD